MIISKKNNFPEQSSEGAIMVGLDKKFGVWDSVVGIMIRYVLQGSVFEHLSRGVQNFLAPPNVPEALSSSFKMNTFSLSQGY